MQWGFSMTLLDIKNLHTTEIKQVQEWCEQELRFREEVGKELEQQKKYRNEVHHLTEKGLRNYPEGCFEYSITRNP